MPKSTNNHVNNGKPTGESPTTEGGWYKAAADALGTRFGELNQLWHTFESELKKIPLPVNPAVAPLFIVQPLLPGGMTRLFSTHPPIEERVARLEKLAGMELPQP